MLLGPWKQERATDVMSQRQNPPNDLALSRGARDRSGADGSSALLACILRTAFR